jgi:hypothetical protein
MKPKYHQNSRLGCILLSIILVAHLPAAFAQSLDVSALARSTMDKAPGRTLATGDFDSDGVPDLVTGKRAVSGDLGHTYSQGRYGFQIDFGGNSSDSVFVPAAANNPPDGVAVVDVNADGQSDFLFGASRWWGGTEQNVLVLAMQRTAAIPLPTSAGGSVKTLTDPIARGGEIAKRLTQFSDLAPLFAELGTDVLPTSNRTLLSSVVGSSNTRIASSFYVLAEEDVSIENRFGNVFWVFDFKRSDLQGTPLRLEVEFARLLDGIHWAAVRCTLIFPQQVLATDIPNLEVAVAKLPGNDQLDIITGEAWYELEPPQNVGTQPGQKTPWEFRVVKRQSLPGMGSPETPILFQNGIQWQLLSRNYGRRLQLRNFTGNQFSAPVELNPPGLLIAEFTIGDLNGDNLVDVAFATDGNSPNNKLFIANGTGANFGTPIEILTLRGDCQDLKTIDFDRDGKRDIVLSDYLPGALIYDTDARFVLVRSLGSGVFDRPVYYQNVFFHLDEILPTTYGTTGGERLVLQTRATTVTNPNGGGTMKTSTTTYFVFGSNLPISTAPPDNTAALRLAGTALNAIGFLPSGKIGFLTYHPIVQQGSSVPSENIFFSEREPAAAVMTGFTLLGANRQFTRHLMLLRGENGMPTAFVHADTGLDQLVHQNSTWTHIRTVNIQGEQIAAASGPDGSFHFVYLEEVDFPAMKYDVAYGRLSSTGSFVKETIATNVTPITVSDLNDFDDLVDYGAHGSRSLGIAVGADGTPHVIFSRGRNQVPIVSGSQTIGTEVRSSLEYATRGVNGIWQNRTLLAPPIGEWGDYGGIGASIAIAPNGTIGVAASIMPRAQTGSPGVARLVYAAITGNESWTTVDSTAAGYVAGAGNRGSGLFPNLAFDGQNRAHLVYTDHAAERFSDRGSKSFSGQVKYARQHGSDWLRWVAISSGGVIPMDSQIFHPTLAVRDDGTAVIAAVSNQWSNASSAWTREFKVQTIAANSLPPQPSPPVAAPSAPAPAPPALSPIQQQILTLESRLTTIRKKVKNPAARAAQIRKIRAQIAKLKRQELAK